MNSLRSVKSFKVHILVSFWLLVFGPLVKFDHSSLFLLYQLQHLLHLVLPYDHLDHFLFAQAHEVLQLIFVVFHEFEHFKSILIGIVAAQAPQVGSTIQVNSSFGNEFIGLLL